MGVRGGTGRAGIPGPWYHPALPCPVYTRSCTVFMLYPDADGAPTRARKKEPCQRLLDSLLPGPVSRVNSAQSGHGSSGGISGLRKSGRSRNRVCLDSRRSEWLLITLGRDFRGGSQIVGGPLRARENTPRITTLSLLSILRLTPVPTHLESHFALLPDPPRGWNNKDSSFRGCQNGSDQGARSPGIVRIVRIVTFVKNDQNRHFWPLLSTFLDYLGVLRGFSSRFAHLF